MSQKVSENSHMSAVEFGSSNEFASYALQRRVAPKALGSVKVRLEHARRIMRRRGWTDNRVRDCWYGYDRVTPNADEIRDLEEITGLRYGRQELRTNDQLIAAADTLLQGFDPSFYGAFAAALRAVASAFDRSRVERD